MLTDTTASPHAVMTSLPPSSVTLDAHGPLGRLRANTLEVTIPSMGDLMFDPQIAHAVENFKIAAGRAQGEHHAAPFMDGDLYKWLEAAVVAEPDAPGLADRVAQAAEAIVAAQRPDGYVHTRTIIAANRGEDVAPLTDRLQFETYNLGHLMTLGCLHKRLTGSDTYYAAALGAAEFLRHAAQERPEALADCNICPSHYMGTIEIYRSTGDARYLDLARRLLELHGDKGSAGGDDNQDVYPVQSQHVATGHAVRANYLFAGMTDYALETGDPAFREAVEALWDDVVSAKLYLTGGCGAVYDGASPDAGQDYSTITKTHQAYGRPFQLPQTTAYNESCATLGFVLWSWRMLALTGEAKYADEIERVLFNSLPAMIGAEGSSYFYTNPMRAVRDLPFQMRRAGDPERTTPPASDHRLRQEYMTNCFCCPPNIARVIAELPYYVYSRSTDALWVHQFLPGTVNLTIGDVPVEVTQTTRYPSEGTVRIRVRAQAPVRATVRVRVPGWAPETAVSVAGEATSAVESGYAVIDRTWSDEEILVEIPLRVRTMVAHHFVEEATNQVAIMRGPVVYCVESADLPDGVGVESVHVPAGAHWSAADGAGIFTDYVTLHTDAVRIPSPVPAGSLYGELREEAPVPLPLALVPYARWANRGPGEMSVWLPRLR
ncbi:glycoside hydrolase family 127 protein [Occultella aeris]|uniref:Non-reducing end beta-L-arabinofuranosidase n=1 Tax=Occultella aeris TaxID=2761496 RepID=A0A7M4DHY7_9MICO|nr:beta-L-arabinofuranosidase domain-containing protein [Occultella aeris]VZO36534.1 Non-reducing end beta-L-arabinofuranosidase [Occultella aeris]